jgi:hypothetical protein
MGLGERRTVQQTGHAVGMAVKTTGAAWGVDHLRSSMGLLHLCLSEVATAIDPPLTQEGPPQIMGEGGRRVQAEVGGACGVVQGGCSVGMYGSGYTEHHSASVLYLRACDVCHSTSVSGEMLLLFFYSGRQNKKGASIFHRVKSWLLSLRIVQ